MVRYNTGCGCVKYQSFELTTRSDYKSFSARQGAPLSAAKYGSLDPCAGFIHMCALLVRSVYSVSEMCGLLMRRIGSIHNALWWLDMCEVLALFSVICWLYPFALLV